MVRVQEELRTYPDVDLSPCHGAGRQRVQIENRKSIEGGNRVREKLGSGVWVQVFAVGGGSSLKPRSCSKLETLSRADMTPPADAPEPSQEVATGSDD